MTRKYNLSHRIIAFVLLISLFLQSCSNSFNPLTPTEDVAINNLVPPLKNVEDGLLFLDYIHNKIVVNPESTSKIMSQLCMGLSMLRKNLSSDDWKEFAKKTSQHRLCQVMHQDPFTKRCFNQPRGYAGDAIMLDYIYKPYLKDIKTIEIDNLSNQAKAIYNNIAVRYTAPFGVISRAHILGQTIDVMYEKNKNLRVLSIAAGHLRELQFSQAFMNNKLKEIVAFDQDPESLKEIGNYYKGKNISLVNGKIKDLFSDSSGYHNLGSFDFIFASGLFDYLKDPIARLLTRQMFNLLNPNGKIYVTNYIDTNVCQGYMETFMDWHLIYRDLAQLDNLSTLIDSSQIKSKALFKDPSGEIGFLEINKIAESSAKSFQLCMMSAKL